MTGTQDKTGKNMYCIYTAGCQWLTSVILVTWVTEIRRIKVQGQSRQIVHKTPSPKPEQNELEV
jgi:hypothetical protein